MIFNLKKLLIFSVILLIIPSLLGIMASSKNIAHVSQEDNKLLIKYSEKEFTHVEYAQIRNGDYSSLEGNWISRDKHNSTRLAVNQGVLIFNNVRYVLSLAEGQTGAAPTLKCRSEKGYQNTAKLSFYPEGVVIPVRLKDGTVDYSGAHDPTNRGTDRLLLSQTILSEEGLKENVCYRKK